MKYRIILSRIKQSFCTLFLTVILFCGCEDVIQVDLNSTEPQLVIEGKISSTRNQSYFKISRTTDFYGQSSFEKVSGAFIVVTDSNGYTDTLTEGLPGEYNFVKRIPIYIERTYYAMVTVDGNTYTASTTLQPPIYCNEMTFGYQEGNDEIIEIDEGYRLYIHFDDRPIRPDYVRIKVDSNGVNKKGIYLYDGRFSDGSEITYNRFYGLFEAGDTVTEELLSMDRTMYYYFKT